MLIFNYVAKQHGAKFIIIKGNAYLQIGNIKIQALFVDKLNPLNICHEIRIISLKAKSSRLRLDGFTTQSDLRLVYYHQLCYKNYFKNNNIYYEKTITQELLDQIKSPLSLAVWYLDDGNARDDCFAGKLCTQGFSYDEQKLLQEFLKDTFGINTKILFHKKATNQYYLAIPAKGGQFKKFTEIIRPIVETEIASMLYKLGKPCNDQTLIIALPLAMQLKIQSMLLGNLRMT
eukprot:TRINITY_DN1812_c0_g1_i1.p1 TRINITY_DN1812_c0_g1~~TRINITY_DN1812_c0_g1_i1.p1  ORF type:complete len:232 (+),score=1.60 TRINITY_DN1812_c0_g1_i1:195-890(+)